MYEAKNEGGDAFLERLDLRLPRNTRQQKRRRTVSAGRLVCCALQCLPWLKIFCQANCLHRSVQHIRVSGLTFS